MRRLTDNRFDKYRIPHPMGEIPPELRAYAGAFAFPNGLRVIASRGGEVHGQDDPGAMWDHVSVSYANRTPSWEDMCWVKSLFFFADEVAMQLHPVEEYINNHPYCLHLWRPIEDIIPMPPSILVGFKELNV